MARCLEAFEKARSYFQEAAFYADELERFWAAQPEHRLKELSEEHRKYVALAEKYSADLHVIRGDAADFDAVVHRFVASDAGQAALKKWNLVSEWLRMDLFPQAETKLAEFQACRLSLTQ